MPHPARDHAGVPVPPPLLFVVPLATGVLLQRRWPLPLPWEAATRPLGLLLVAVGLGFTLSAAALFLRARTSVLPVRPTTALVTQGPYRITRNPMYVGFVALYLGVSAWADTLWPLLFLPLVIALVRRLAIDREERYLEAKFGDAYRDYRARVRRWL